MYTDMKDSKSEVMKIPVYGISASSIKNGVKEITGINPGNDTVETRETGRIAVMPEVYTILHACDGGGGGGSECDIICFVILLVMLMAIAIVWVVVMIVFSIFTLGGFIKRRYRSLVVIERDNPEFIGKLSVLAFNRGGIANYTLNDEVYDEWMASTFDLFKKLKYIRQLSLFLGFIWGATELGFKLYQIAFDPTFNYNLWSLRYVMIIIFIPLIFYSPILEMKLKNAFETGDDIVVRLLNNRPKFNPDTPMIFEEKPILSKKKITPK
jgi:hypothetical protein